MQIINSIDRILARIESVTLVIVLTSMIVMSFLQVILRNFFDYSILWADIFSRHMILWVGFIGASLATYENKHINIDVLSRFLSPKVKQFSKIITKFFSAFISILLAKASYVFITDERAAGSTLFWGIPVWVFMIIILIGFVIMSFRFVIQAIQTISSPKLTEEKD